MNPNSQSTTVKKLFDLLTAIATLKENATLTNICLETAMNKSTAHRILNTAEILGYLENIDKVYKPTARLRAVTVDRYSDSDFVEMLIAPLRDLSNELDTAVDFCVSSGLTDYRYALRFKKGEMERDKFGETRKERLLSSAAGRVILAYDEGLKRAFRRSISYERKIEKELTEIKEKGVAVDEGRCAPNLVCIAFPIFNYQNFVGALSLSWSQSGVVSENEIKELEQVIASRFDPVAGPYKKGYRV